MYDGIIRVTKVKTESNELLPCPFCGGEASIVHCEPECCGAKPRWVECRCGCELGGRWQNDDEAIASWNARSPRTKDN